MKTMKIIIFNIALIVSVFQYGTVFSAEEKVAEVAAQTACGRAIEGLDLAGPYIGLTVKAYKIGEEIRKYNFPTLKEEAHAEKVAEDFALLTAENDLQRCFIDNRSSIVRNRFGRPVACENIAELLTVLGGHDEVTRMTSIYNQYRV